MSVFVSDIGDSNCPNLRKSRKKYYTKYSLKYKTEYPWALPSSKGELFAFCNLCYIDISIKSVGAKGLRDHEATCRHSQKAHEVGLGSIAEAASLCLQQKPYLHSDLNCNRESSSIIQDISAAVSLNCSYSNTCSEMIIDNVPNSKDNEYTPAISGFVNTPHLTAAHTQPLSSIMLPALKEVQLKIYQNCGSSQIRQDLTTFSTDISQGNFSQRSTPENAEGVESVTGIATIDFQKEANFISQKNLSKSEQEPADVLSYATMQDSTSVDLNNEKKKHKGAPQLRNANSVSVDDLTCSICGKYFSNWKLLKLDLMQHIEAANVKKTELQATQRGRHTSRNKNTSTGSAKEFSQTDSATAALISLKIKSDTNVVASPKAPEQGIKSKKLGRPLNDNSNSARIISMKDQKVFRPDDLHKESIQNALNEPEHGSQNRIKRTKRCGQLQCRVCKSMFYLRHDLKSHYEKEHNNGRPYWCDVCDKSFTTRNNMQVHKKHKHTNGPNPCLCTFCCKVLSSRTNLKIHMMIHKGEKPFRCPVCGKCFSRKGNMEMHLVYHTGERSFTCEICGHSFFAINALKRHKKLHSGEREYKCNVCDATYVTGTDLRRHGLKHEDVKPFPCKICEKQFTRSHDLKVHMRYHNKEIQFTCKECGKQFVESGNFRRHMRRHTGERPYSCTICSQTFSQVHHYKEHVRTSHPNEDSKAKDESTLSSYESQLLDNKLIPLYKKAHCNNPPKPRGNPIFIHQQVSPVARISSFDGSQSVQVQNFHAAHVRHKKAAEVLQINSSASPPDDITPVSTMRENPNEHSTIITSAAHMPTVASHHTQLTQTAVSHTSTGLLQYNSYIYNNGVISPYQQFF